MIPAASAVSVAFARTIGTEGGLVDNPADPGGLTKWGISARAYPDVDIRNLTQAGAEAIFLRDVWGPLELDQLDPAVAFQLFDMAVNEGSAGAVSRLQRALKIPADGRMGPETLAAIKARPPAVVIMLLVAASLDEWRGLSTWPNFGRGWAKRGALNLRYGAGDVAAG